MTTESFERKLTAILSADVQGYSRLMRTDEDETVRTLTAYRRTIARHVVKYRGRVVDSPGDNLLAEFGSGLDAVNCAVEIQRELAERNEELPPERQMEFRIGVNSGDVIQEGDRIYGDGVNIAARVEGLAEGGGVSISGTVYDSIEGKLGLEFEYQGEHEVKNIDKPIRVYRVLSYPGAAAHRVVKAKRAISKAWRNIMVLIAAMLVIGGALAVWHFYLRPPPVEVVTEAEMAFPLPDKPSIVVLPFMNMSGDPEQEYLADGITEQITTALSKAGDLFVVSRSSAFIYKGKPVKVKQVSQELGVRYVLEGSLRKSSDRVRITAQLIDALTGHHLWAEDYDRDLKDILDLQDEITIQILSHLPVETTSGQLDRYFGIGTKNLKAFIKTMKAYKHLIYMTREGIMEARKLCEEAIALDPEYPMAYHTLAWTYLLNVWFGKGKSAQDSMAKAHELAKKTLALDESYPGAHTLLGSVYMYKKEHEKAIPEFERAIALDPNSDLAYMCLGEIYSHIGRPKEAVELLKKSMRLNPLSQTHASKCLFRLGKAYRLLGQYEESLSALKKAAEIRPNAWFIQMYLAATYIYMGREEEARSAAAEVLKAVPNFSLENFEKKSYHENKEELKRFINALRKAGLK